MASEFLEQVGRLLKMKFTEERVEEPDEGTAREWASGE